MCAVYIYFSLMKIIDTILKIVLCLICAMPVAGVTGLLGEPTRELYNTDEAFAFIMMLTDTGYIVYINAVVFAAAIALIITNRVALAALLILPITVNIVSFHAFLDGGLFTAGALLGNVMFLINLYFLWKHRAQYERLWNRGSA